MTIRVYKAASGSHFGDEEAQKLGSFLDKKFGDKPFQSADVVRVARDEKSPLHPYFEWDDATAAEKHRESQAALLVRHIVVTESHNGQEIESRGFHYVRVATDDEGSTEGAFVPHRVVWKDTNLANQVVAKALGELRSWKQRYQTYSDLASAVTAVQTVISELEVAA